MSLGEPFVITLIKQHNHIASQPVEPVGNSTGPELEWGPVLDVRHCPVVSCYAQRCLTKLLANLVRRRKKTMLTTDWSGHGRTSWKQFRRELGQICKNSDLKSQSYGCLARISSHVCCAVLLSHSQKQDIAFGIWWRCSRVSSESNVASKVRQHWKEFVSSLNQVEPLMSKTFLLHLNFKWILWGRVALSLGQWLLRVYWLMYLPSTIELLTWHKNAKLVPATD